MFGGRGRIVESLVDAGGRFENIITVVVIVVIIVIAIVIAVAGIALVLVGASSFDFLGS